MVIFYRLFLFFFFFLFCFFFFFFFQAEDGIRDVAVTGVQTCALPISPSSVSAIGPGFTRTNGSVGYIADLSGTKRQSTPRSAASRRSRSRSRDRKSTRLNSSHGYISYAVFCLKKKRADLAAAPGAPAG